MTDRVVHSVLVGIRDVPRTGPAVRIFVPQSGHLDLTPEQAGELAEAIEQAGVDAIREAGRRRTPPESPPT